jgi:hypothetical protein
VITVPLAIVRVARTIQTMDGAGAPSGPGEKPTPNVNAFYAPIGPAIGAPNNQPPRRPAVASDSGQSGRHVGGELADGQTPMAAPL